MNSTVVFTDYPVPSEDGVLRQLRCSSFIIVDREYGGIVFDTGSPYGTKQLSDGIYKATGLNPDQIKWVFNTHIHPDHVGSNLLFSKAKKVFSRKDMEFYNLLKDAAHSDIDFLEHLHKVCPGYRSIINQFDADKIKLTLKIHYSPEKLAQKGSFGYLEDDTEIPPFIKPIQLFGHTHFHYGYIISRKTELFVTGDACTSRYIFKGHDHTRLGEPHVDFDAYFKSLAIIKDFKGVIVPGHDNAFVSSTLLRVKPDQLTSIIDNSNIIV